MSIIAALTKKWSYSVENPGAGGSCTAGQPRIHVSHLRGGRDMGAGGAPSSQRVHFCFSWYPCHREFSAPRERIVPRIAEHFRMSGARVRVFEQDCGDFQFHPELFEHRSRAAELLETAGYTWSAISAPSNRCTRNTGWKFAAPERAGRGADSGGAPTRFSPLASPGDKPPGPCREPGWTVSLCMFPARPCGMGWHDAD